MYVISDSYRDDNSDLHHSSFSFRLKCFIFLKKIQLSPNYKINLLRRALKYIFIVNDSNNDKY